jgi:hypothetical protein
MGLRQCVAKIEMAFRAITWTLRPQPWRGGIAMAVLLAMTARAMSAQTVAPQSFEAFKIIGERNIFDPRPSRQHAVPGEAPRASREKFILVGTMSYEKGEFAFFDGSNADFKRELKVGDKVGGLSVTAIGFTQVKLKAGAAQLELPVGGCLIRENGGEWQPGGKADDIAAPAEAAAPTTPPAAVRDSGSLVKAEKEFDSDPEKSAKWAAKKLKKHPGETDAERKEDKLLRKMLDGSFKDPARKAGKQDKYG